MDFDTLIVTRDIACPPARLFALMTDREARQTWGAPDDRTVMRIDAFDLRPGGHELSVCGPAEAPEFQVRMDFHVIDAPSRLIGTETLDLGEGPAAISLVTHEIAAEGAGSRLTVTIQAASLVGPDMMDGYREGWTGALGNLARLAEEEA